MSTIYLPGEFLPTKRSPSHIEEESTSENSSTVDFKDHKCSGKPDHSATKDYPLPHKKKCNNELTINPELIEKIIAGSKKKKKDPRNINLKPAALKLLLTPPCIVYSSKGNSNVLKIPSAHILNRLMPQHVPVEKTSRVCKCGKAAKYRLPKTLEPYCGLSCYKMIKG